MVALAKPRGEIMPKSTFVLGVDLARMGEDSTVFVVLEKPFDDNDVYVAFIKEVAHNLLNEAADYIKFLDTTFHFEKIYIDTTGLGSGVFDFLTADQSFNYRCVDCMFGSNLDGKPFKEVMFSNLKMLMEKTAKGQSGGLHLPNHKKLLYQLIDLRYEIANNGRVKIHHSDRGHDDLADALALACLYFKPTEQTQGCWDVA